MSDRKQVLKPDGDTSGAGIAYPSGPPNLNPVFSGGRVARSLVLCMCFSFCPFSFDCKLDLYVLDGNLTDQKYRDNVLAPRVVPHFDNRALADRPMFMDDNARPHRARIVQHFLGTVATPVRQQFLIRQYFEFWIALVNFSANKVPYILYRVHVLRHRRPWNCLNSLLL
jgi:hypothetical protein